MQRLEMRLATSLITQSNSLDLQGSSSMPATYQSIFEDKKCLTAFTTTTEVATKGADTNRPPFLRTLLLKLLSVFVAPLGYFEMLSSFRPETYTVYDIGPQIIYYSFALAEKDPEVATFTQDLFIAKSQRHWIRIKLRMTVAVGTTHWRLLAEHTPEKNSWIGWRQLPQNVISLIQQVMTENLEVSDDTEINVSFDKNPQATVCGSNPRATCLTRMLNTNNTDNVLNLTESLRHQNVRMIPETALVTAYLQGTSLVANLDNQWVLYRNATAGKSGFDFLWCAVQARISLRGAPRVAQLVSVILDSEKKLLKGILVELPSKGPMFRIMDTHRFKGKPIPWPIRQK